MTLNGPLLQITGLARAGLTPTDLALDAGSCCAIMGPSGAGKSIFLRSVADLDPHDGEAYLNGLACSAMPGPVWRRKVTYVAAEPGWWAETVAPHMTRPELARQLLPKLNLPDDVLAAPVSRLSTGERQRLALIRALIQGPEVLLLDEPTGALDAASREQVADLLDAERDRGLGLLIATHDPALAERMGGRTCHMRSGHLEPADP